MIINAVGKLFVPYSQFSSDAAYREEPTNATAVAMLGEKNETNIKCCPGVGNASENEQRSCAETPGEGERRFKTW